MAQGIGWNRDEVIEILKPFYKMGCNTAKACSYAGIPRTTVQTWIENDDTLRLKLEAWQNEPNALARSNWLAKMAEGDFDAAKEWMKRKEKDEFSDRVEHTGENGEPLKIVFDNSFTDATP